MIRADDETTLSEAFARLARLLAVPAVRHVDLDAAEQILIESFVPGPEIALEGLLSDGRLDVLTVFDKPDPLDGPFFEETLYVTPSRLPPEDQQHVARTVAAAAAALGLTTGPVHAELRLAPHPVVIEVAARPIGGLCPERCASKVSSVWRTWSSDTRWPTARAPPAIRVRRAS